MDLRKITSSFGIVLTLIGGGYAADYTFDPDVQIGSRFLTEAEYEAEKTAIMDKYRNKTSDLFFWTKDGKEVLSVIAIEIHNCIDREIEVSDLAIKDENGSLIDSLHELITNECL